MTRLTMIEDNEDIVPIGAGNSYDRATGELLEYDDSEETFVCANCEGEFTQEDLKPSKDLSERVYPGEIVPAGDCPSCGAFCYPKETTDELYPTDDGDDSYALASAGFGTDEDYGFYSGEDY